MDRFINSDSPLAVEMMAFLYQREILPINSNPAYEDTDGDGLLDGKRQFRYLKVMLPIDPHPLKCDGPEGIWLAQQEAVEKFKVQTAYGWWPSHPHVVSSTAEKYADVLVDILLNNTWLPTDRC